METETMSDMTTAETETKTIPETFRKWGDAWTLVDRTKKRALYHREGEQGEHWEVLSIGRRKEGRWPNGDLRPAGEYLKMGDTDYGESSWCFLGTEKDRAKCKLLERR